MAAPTGALREHAGPVNIIVIIIALADSLHCKYDHLEGLRAVTVGPTDHHWMSLICSLSVAVEVADPGVALGTLLLAGGELSHVSLVLQLALVLLPAATPRSVGEVTVEDGRGVDLHNNKRSVRQRS